MGGESDGDQLAAVGAVVPDEGVDDLRVAGPGAQGDLSLGLCGRGCGSVRADPIETESGTLQFEMPPDRTEAGLTQVQGSRVAEIRYHELDVPEDLLAGSLEDLLRELERRVK